MSLETPAASSDASSPDSAPARLPLSRTTQSRTTQSQTTDSARQTINHSSDAAGRSPAERSPADRSPTERSPTERSPDNQLVLDVHWLSWLSHLVDAQWLCLFFPTDKQPAISWPRQIKIPAAAVALTKEAWQRKRVVNTRIQPRDLKVSVDLLAIPLTGDQSGSQSDQALAILVLAVPLIDKSQQAALVRLCRWAALCPYQSELSSSGNSANSADTNPAAESSATKPVGITSKPASHDTTRSDTSLNDDVLGANLHDHASVSIALQMANTLAKIYSCSRVSIGSNASGRNFFGWIDRSAVSIHAVSHQARVDAQRNLPKSISAVMSESVSKGSGLYMTVHSLNTTNMERPEQAELLTSEDSEAVLTLCFEVDGISIAATLEWPDNSALTADEVDEIGKSLESAVGLFALALQAERRWIRRIMYPIDDQCRAWLAGRVSAKQVAYGLAAMLLAASFVMPITYRLTADVNLGARDRQMIAAPQDGIISTVSARAGDIVVAGQLLATLDTRDLQLIRVRWQSELIKNQQAQAQAMAIGERAEYGRLKAEAQGLQAELTLADSQLRRSSLVAPFAGMVVSGDLSEALGAPVSAGDVLFEIATSDHYELNVDIDEHDVADIAPGQVVDVRFAAIPGRIVRAEIQRLLPVSDSGSGKNVFRAKADLLDSDVTLTPGMQGVGKISAGSMSIASAYTRNLRHTLARFAWKIGVLK